MHGTCKIISKMFTINFNTFLEKYIPSQLYDQLCAYDGALHMNENSAQSSTCFSGNGLIKR